MFYLFLIAPGYMLNELDTHDRFSAILYKWYSFFCDVMFTFSLRKHAYSNILKILPPKNENFQIKKKSLIFMFLLKTLILGTRWNRFDEYP